MSWGSWLFSAHRNRENSSPPSPPGGSAVVMQEPWIWVWKTKMCEKSWIFVQIGPDQNSIKSLLLSLLQCLVGACFQEQGVVGGCQEQGKVLEGSLTGPPEKWEPPWGTVLTTAQREPPPSCSVRAAPATREDAAASLAFSSSSFSINDFSLGQKTLVLIRPVQHSGVWMSVKPRSYFWMGNC